MSDIQEQIKLAHKKAEENDNLINKTRLNPREIQILLLEKDKEIERLNNIIDGLEKYLEERKTYYCMGCSHFYEDSLGKTRLVNEDIFNEITKIKDKLNELKGDNK